MKLHRSNNKPDWELADLKSLNVWQRMASATRGIVTPGNVATLIGIVLVVIGLMQILDKDYWLGCVVIIIGRLCDLLDGWLAELTKTKSPLGEILDATVDKLGTIFTVVVFYVAMLAPWWVLTVLLLPHIIIAYVSLKARRDNVALHPSRTGKLSMAAVWVALFGLVAIQIFSWPVWSAGFVVVYVVAVVSVLLGLIAAVGYMFNRD